MQRSVVQTDLPVKSQCTPLKMLKGAGTEEAGIGVVARAGDGHLGVLSERCRISAV